eukprot:m.346393 g.346393  ORF g.346393 m.346393 type:complete len:623 (+) comp28977_c0_seq1:1427-3295(+)
MNSQSLANMLWGLAKLEIRPNKSFWMSLEDVDVTLWDIENANPQNVVMILWSLASLDHEIVAHEANDTFLDSIIKIIARLAEKMNSQDITNALWGLAKLFPDFSRQHDNEVMATGVCAQALARRLELVWKEMHLQAKVLSVWASSKLFETSKKQLISLILEDILNDQNIHELHAQNVGLLSFAYGISELKDGRISKHLRRRTKAVLKDITWQTVAHIDYMMRQAGIQLDPKWNSLRNSLYQYGKELVEKLNLESFKAKESSIQAMKSLRLKGQTILTCGRECHTLAKILQKFDCETRIWTRYCEGSKSANLRLEKIGSANACCFLLPTSKEEAMMLLDVATMSVKENGYVYVVGSMADGIANLRTHLEASGWGSLKYDWIGSLAVVSAQKAKNSNAPFDLSGYKSRLTLTLPISCKTIEDWSVYPGLFAGGKVDIMTSYFLSCLPKFEENATVLDFACGSGVIAATLLSIEPSLVVDILDSDALAMHCCQENVPEVNESFVSDTWAKVNFKGKQKLYDFIVSNPPVHIGRQQNFAVVQALIEGSKQHLKPNGQLWLVAQQNIPVGCMLADSYNFCTQISNGRFTTWCASSEPIMIASSGKKRKSSNLNSGNSVESSKKLKKL